jgi:hypothetical protein
MSGHIKSLIPAGGCDKVMTPPLLAARLIEHFGVYGRCLEPCRGDGAFYRCLPIGSGWCELDDGRDFLTFDFGQQHFDWAITNPPWSKIRPFLARAIHVADNVVFLCLINAIFMKARLKLLDAGGFGIREILLVDTPSEWPSCGIQLGAIHVQRGPQQPIIFGKLD